MNLKLFFKFLSRFSLIDYGVWTYVACFVSLVLASLARYIELQSVWDAVILLVWPIYGIWLFLRYFALEMIIYDTFIPSWVGYLCFLFFIGWIFALLAFKQKKIRNIVIILLLLFALIFIGGCTYMTGALSPYGLV